MSNQFFIIKGNKTVEVDDIVCNRKKEPKDLKIALICNWQDKCGISTYTEFLVNALKLKIKEIKVFSEENNSNDPNVVYCWKRGHSMLPALAKIKEYNPDLVLIQHEFGIFPKATYFLQMLQLLSNIPYVVALHSVYEHLDKTICTSSIKNIIVHTEEAKSTLRKLGNNNNVYVVPHGCVENPKCEELWNIFQTPYAIVQFGFGFYYKGVDRALDAIAYLKKADPKFNDIFYCYLCSQNDNTSYVHEHYYNFLLEKIEELNLGNNVVIIKGYHSEEIINNYLRTAKLAIFPYTPDPTNIVYGASGAIRIAMANKIPVLASESHLFDDLEGIVPRPNNHLSLAKEIDEIFSNWKYRKAILDKSENFIKENTWDKVANKYIEVFRKII